MPGFSITSQEGIAPSPFVETARSYRWRVEFLTLGTIDPNRELNLYAYSVSRPVWECDQIVMYNRQNEIKLPGKYRWGTIDLKFYEKVTDADKINSVAEVIKKWRENVIFNFRDHSIRTIENVNRQSMRIILLDGHGRNIWGYKLFMPFPIKIEPSTMDYATSEISSTVVTLAFSGVLEGKDI